MREPRSEEPIGLAREVLHVENVTGSQTAVALAFSSMQMDLFSVLLARYCQLVNLAASCCCHRSSLGLVQAGHAASFLPIALALSRCGVQVSLGIVTEADCPMPLCQAGCVHAGGVTALEESIKRQGSQLHPPSLQGSCLRLQHGRSEQHSTDCSSLCSLPEGLRDCTPCSTKEHKVDKILSWQIKAFNLFALTLSGMAIRDLRESLFVPRAAAGCASVGPSGGECITTACQCGEVKGCWVRHKAASS